MNTSVDATDTSTDLSTRIDFLYLSEPDMVAAGVTDMAACVDTMERMFRVLGAGDYRMAGKNADSHGAMVTFPDAPLFPRMPRNAEDRRFMAMPAYLGGDFHAAGVKWYGSNVENKKAGLPRSIHLFVLNDVETGAPVALMSANLLSAMRTGAIPGVGARQFAREDSRVVGIVGPGVMARTALQSFIVARPGIELVKVKGRGARGEQAFREWAEREFPGLRVEIVATNEDAVRDADIVTYCTTSGGTPENYPELRREWVAPGAYLAMPSSVRLDEALLAPDVRTVVDNTGLYEAWADEFPYPTYASIPIVGCHFTDLIHEGRMAPEEMEDIGKILASGQGGRRSDEEIVLFSIGGMPVEDVAWATQVLANARDRGIGTPLNLWDVPVLA
ncbi:tyramine oxidase subunit B [Microbacterium trichothecenolyticum]|uniref:Ornithine cyclodeaminase/alanine dehydrogenase-like protein (Mu-crystallin family) n=1 Tax=Microbacterium trichothecenolyticum TaxID=69370 RepID=A0ABU0TWW1_MICTR|nr:tyramine oxidase subunit B [Microbacterium trichothecenolyticum]MDQ1124141.1 ornithine cyclodeaminase/alanine dehydrogenase-like protein (mu-crystallin family) [Microbacterium trichothecenolyticum]